MKDVNHVVSAVLPLQCLKTRRLSSLSLSFFSVAAVFLVLYCFEQMRPRGSSASYSTLLTTQAPGK